MPSTCEARNYAQDEEAEPAVPVKAERPGRDHSSVANKKTNLRSEDQTFKVQEEQRSVYILPAVTYRAAQLAAIQCKQPYRMLLAYGMLSTGLLCMQAKAERESGRFVEACE